MAEAPVFPAKVDVVGSGISTTSIDELLRTLAAPRTDRATVVAVCNVHSVMSARRDPVLRAAIADADVATPDGMPLVWAIRRLYRHHQERVAGPDLMRRSLESGEGSHFFLGGSPETLVELASAVASFAPTAIVAGTFSPPFGPLSEMAIDEHVQAIRDSGADVVWVGLGMPKQELWMAHAAPHLPGVTLVGVGAAFDFLAGTVVRAPEWMQRTGLEWLHRLLQEPRRLWRRYLFNNPGFLVAFAGQARRSLLAGLSRRLR